MCRYAHAMYCLRHLGFTYYDAFQDKDLSVRDVNRPKYMRKAFKYLITEGVTFQFGPDDINRIRDEFKALIRNLSRSFQNWKRPEIVAAKREGRKEENNDSKENETETVNLNEDESNGVNNMSEEEEAVLVDGEDSDGPSLSPERDDRMLREDSSDSKANGGSDNPITLQDDFEAPQAKTSSSSSSVSSNDRTESMSTNEMEMPTAGAVKTNQEDQQLQQHQHVNDANEMNQYSAEDQSENRPSQDEDNRDSIWKEIKSRVSL